MNGTLRWEDAARSLFRLGCLTAEQLALLSRPSSTVPGKSAPHGVTPPACSREAARRALVHLLRRGIARRHETIPPWRHPRQGRPLLAYSLTNKGITAGGYLSGMEEASAKRLRGMYARAFSEWTINHNMLRNAWICGAFREAALRSQGLCVEEAAGEHGAVLRDEDRPASTTVEADGLLRLSHDKDPGWSLSILVEADTGSQGKAEITRKAERYLACLDGLSRPDPEKGTWPPLPVVLFFSPSPARSERVAAWVAEVAAKQEGWSRSLREGGVEPDHLFLVSCLPWSAKNGALGNSCFSVLSREQRSVLSAPYARPGSSAVVPN